MFQNIPNGNFEVIFDHWGLDLACDIEWNVRFGP